MTIPVRRYAAITPPSRNQPNFGQHQRKGRLWEDRFKSVIVEDGVAARTMAAYIDLRIREGLTTAEALAAKDNGTVLPDIGLAAMLLALCVRSI